MPNPKKKHSRTRRNKRRSHDGLSTPSLTLCSQCGEPKLPHHACTNCGMYRGRAVIKIEE